MARYYRKPGSAKVVEIGTDQVLAVVFFGPIYLYYAELWPHLALWIVAYGIGLLAGPPWLLLPVVGLPLVYAFRIQHIVTQDYLKQGWVPVQAAQLAQ